jgi:hypothetical protein
VTQASAIKLSLKILLHPRSCSNVFSGAFARQRTVPARPARAVKKGLRVSELANLEAALRSLGIDPKHATEGFRAESPFVVAVMLAARGFRVMPSNKKKIPKIKQWQLDASTDPATIARWQNQFQSPCWSVLTGNENGVWILDVDGPKGREDLVRLESELGPLPQTWSVASGRVSGGEHRWFGAAPGGEDLRTVAHVLGCAIDVRGWHGHAVLSGSRHTSGNRYRWADGCAPDECELAELPAPWVEAVRGGRRGAVLDGADSAPSQHDPTSLRIGDGEGYGGFQNPIFRNALRYFHEAGADASEDKITEALRRMIVNAPKGPGRSIDRYMAGGDLERAVGRAREFVLKGKDDNECER